MFDVGFTEIVLIGIVALIVIGPERLPAVAKTVGQWIGKLQRFVKGVKTDLASELETGDLKKLIGDQREQINELRDMVSSTKKGFQETSASILKSTKEGLNELETTVKNANSDEPDQPANTATETPVESATKPAVAKEVSVDQSVVTPSKTQDSAVAQSWASKPDTASTKLNKSAGKSSTDNT